MKEAHFYNEKLLNMNNIIFLIYNCKCIKNYNQTIFMEVNELQNSCILK